jgi:ABC-2 type transport system ATP-binding protein
LLADDTPVALRTFGQTTEIHFAAQSGIDTAALGHHLEATVIERAIGEYVVALPPSPATVAALTAWLAERDITLGDLRGDRQSLEDVFLRLTAEPGEQRDTA